MRRHGPVIVHCTDSEDFLISALVLKCLGYEVSWVLSVLTPTHPLCGTTKSCPDAAQSRPDVVWTPQQLYNDCRIRRENARKSDCSWASLILTNCDLH